MKFFKPIGLVAMLLCSSIFMFGCARSKTSELDQKIPAPATNAVGQPGQNGAAAGEKDKKEVNVGEWKSYRNEQLGVSFEYDEFDMYSGKPHLVKTESDKIILYVQGDDFGHTIIVFDLKGQAVKEYIEKNFLKGADPRCRIDIEKGVSSLNYKYANNYWEISVNSSDSENSAESIYGIDCGQYGNQNAIAYFLYNENVPGKLLWVSLGQDTSLKHYQDFLSSISIF
jgi:hypothetical protein